MPWAAIAALLLVLGALLALVVARRRRDPTPEKFDADLPASMVGVGYADEHSVRLWLRAPRPGQIRVCVHRPGEEAACDPQIVEPPLEPESDFTAVVHHPGEGAEPLRPGTRYQFSLEHQTEGHLGSGTFTTAPGDEDVESPFSFGLLSCHQPFTEKGSVDPRARRMLTVAGEAFERHAVERVLMAGDQLYSDAPEPLSLFDRSYFERIAPPGRDSIFDCTRQEIRQIYHRRYRRFWSIEEFQALQRRWATHFAIDDHDILDNFGSAPEHSDARDRVLLDGALDAFSDYQGRRNLDSASRSRPESFDHGFDYGPVAAYVMDLRSERRMEGDRMRVYSDRQHRALESFLERHRSTPVVLLVVTVPLLHIPDWLASTGAFFAEDSDAADRWSHAAQADRRRLVQLLVDHRARAPAQRIVLCSGDIHVGLACQFRGPRLDPPAYQLVSSAVTNVFSPMAQRMAELTPDFAAQLDEDLEVEAGLLPGCEGADGNPYGGLNVGVVTVYPDRSAGASVRLRLISATEGDPPRPEIVFDSGRL